MRHLNQRNHCQSCRNIVGRQASSGGGAAAAGQAQAEGQAAAASGGARFRADQNRTDGGFLHKVKLGEDWWEGLSAKLTHLYV